MKKVAGMLRAHRDPIVNYFNGEGSAQPGILPFCCS